MHLQCINHCHSQTKPIPRRRWVCDSAKTVAVGGGWGYKSAELTCEGYQVCYLTNVLFCMEQVHRLYIWLLHVGFAQTSRGLSAPGARGGLRTLCPPYLQTLTTPLCALCKRTGIGLQTPIHFAFL